MFVRRAVGDADHPNVWFGKDADDDASLLGRRRVRGIEPIVLANEEAVGRAMLDELESMAEEKASTAGPDAPLSIALLGGRGAQALHRLLGSRVVRDPADPLVRRLVVFTQDALAPRQLDDNPGLWVRLHDDVRSYVLGDVLD